MNTHTAPVPATATQHLFALEESLFDLLDRLAAGSATAADKTRLAELDARRRDALTTLRERGYVW